MFPKKIPPAWSVYEPVSPQVVRLQNMHTVQDFVCATCHGPLVEKFFAFKNSEVGDYAVVCPNGHKAGSVLRKTAVEMDAAANAERIAAGDYELPQEVKAAGKKALFGDDDV